MGSFTFQGPAYRQALSAIPAFGPCRFRHSGIRWGLRREWIPARIKIILGNMDLLSDALPHGGYRTGRRGGAGAGRTAVSAKDFGKSNDYEQDLELGTSLLPRLRKNYDKKTYKKAGTDNGGLDAEKKPLGIKSCMWTRIPL